MLFSHVLCTKRKKKLFFSIFLGIFLSVILTSAVGLCFHLSGLRFPEQVFRGYFHAPIAIVGSTYVGFFMLLCVLVLTYVHSTYSGGFPFFSWIIFGFLVGAIVGKACRRHKFRISTEKATAALHTKL